MDDEEYTIDAAAFCRALVEQRQMRLKGGIYHQTQIQLAYNTNHIEGSTLSEEQTRYLYETRTVAGPASVDDVIETMNHFRMFDYMLDTLDKPITAEKIKTYHAMLKTGTKDADKEWFNVGEWKQRANFIGENETTPPELVAQAIQELLTATPQQMSFTEVCDFHYHFEAIHPFQDGNGRVGRILMFEQCLKNQIMPFVVLDNSKFYYYRGLREYEVEPGFLRETMRSFQDAYYKTFKNAVPGAAHSRQYS